MVVGTSVVRVGWVLVRLAKNVRELKPHSFVFSPHFDQQVLGRASCWVPKFISSSALVSYLLTLTSFPPSSTPNLYLRGALNLVKSGGGRGPKTS